MHIKMYREITLTHEFSTYIPVFESFILVKLDILGIIVQNHVIIIGWLIFSSIFIN